MEDLLEIARTLPDGGDVDRFLEALATADDEQFDGLLDALDRSRTGDIVARVMPRLQEATRDARAGAAELFDNLDVPLKACLMGEELDVMLAFDLPGGVMFVPEGWGHRHTLARGLNRLPRRGRLPVERHGGQVRGGGAAALRLQRGPVLPGPP